MERLERDTSGLGGGSGKTHFESENFTVKHWSLQRGKQTTLRCNLARPCSLEIRFNGYVDFSNDQDCISQLYLDEILEIIHYQSEDSFERGRRDKAREIRKALYI